MTKVIHGGDIYRYAVELIDFSSNINPLGVPPVVEELLKKDLAYLARYPDLEYRVLRQKFADLHRLDWQQVIVGNGAVEIIYLMANLFKGRKVLLPQPTFGEYQKAVEQVNGQVELVFRKKENDFALPLAEIEEKLPNVAGIILCNPNNPTGNLVAYDQLVELVEKTRCLNKYLIIDEAFIDFVSDPEKSTGLQWLDQHPKMLIIRALTKFFAIPGLRFGYGLGGRELISHLKAQQIPWSVNSLAAQVAERVITESDYIQRSREWIRREQAFLVDQLEKISQIQVWPTEANFILSSLTSAALTAKDLQAKLISYGILIRDASSFFGLAESYFRVAIKDRASNQKLVAALKDCLS